MLLDNKIMELNEFVSNNTSLYIEEFYNLLSNNKLDIKIYSYLKKFEINNNNLILLYLYKKNIVNNIKPIFNLKDLFQDYYENKLFLDKLSFFNFVEFIIYLHKNKYIKLSITILNNFKIVNKDIRISKVYYNLLLDYLNNLKEKNICIQEYKYIYFHNVNNKEYKYNEFEISLLEDIKENNNLLLDYNFFDFVLKIIIESKCDKKNITNELNNCIKNLEIDETKISNIFFYNLLFNKKNIFIYKTNYQFKDSIKYNNNFKLDIEIIKSINKENNTYHKDYNITEIYNLMESLSLDIKLKNIYEYTYFLINYFSILNRYGYDKNIKHKIKFYLSYLIELSKENKKKISNELFNILHLLNKKNLLNNFFESDELFNLLNFFYSNIHKSKKNKEENFKYDDILILRDYFYIRFYNRKTKEVLKVYNNSRIIKFKNIDSIHIVFNFKNIKKEYLNDLKELEKVEVSKLLINSEIEYKHLSKTIDRNIKSNFSKCYIINLYKFIIYEELFNLYYENIKNISINNFYIFSLMLLNLKTNTIKN